MFSDDKFVNFYRRDIDCIFNDLAKECKDDNKSIPENMYIVGLAAIVLRHSFRESCDTIDAVFSDPTFLKEKIRKFIENNKYEYDCLNDNFVNTSIYSEKIPECSEFYKTYLNCLNVYILKDEYLIAMILKSPERLTDKKAYVEGIPMENEEKRTPLDIPKIKAAYKILYNEELSAENQTYLNKIFSYGDFEKLYWEGSSRNIEKIVNNVLENEIDER